MRLRWAFGNTEWLLKADYVRDECVKLPELSEDDNSEAACCSFRQINVQANRVQTRFKA